MDHTCIDGNIDFAELDTQTVIDIIAFIDDTIRPAMQEEVVADIVLKSYRQGVAFIDITPSSNYLGPRIRQLLIENIPPLIDVNFN